MGQLICELYRPGMTALHRVGLAGRYMTLEAFERDPLAKAELDEAGVRWQREERRVVIDLSEEKKSSGFAKLFERSFRLDDRGFVRLPALESSGPPSLQQKWLLYQALMGTFLQHGRHRQTEKKRALIIEIEDKHLRIPEFAPIQRYCHQEAHKDFFGKKGRLNKQIPLVGWLYPGGSQRHVAWADSYLEESPELALCLVFAPAGTIFFQIGSRRRGRKARTALVIPQVDTLDRYARLRRAVAQHGVLELTAASPTDAALHLAMMAKAQEIEEVARRPIRVLAFGIVDWSEQQKTRTSAYTVTPEDLPGIRNYEIASGIFLTRWQMVEAKRDRKGQVTEPAHHFARPLTAREIVSDNVASRRYWYAGFADYMSDSETRIALQFERKELFRMIKEADYDHENERIFIAACHEAWRRRLGQLGERARRENVAFSRLASGEYERLRVTLARCKNAASFRAALTDFWSRAGSIPALREGWQEILSLLEESTWKKARDLSLLALASYQASTPEEQAAVDAEKAEP